ncbi:GntR family transcriptional regulator (plasmid) [Paroceanicella profunda]|uniref:GntR family transcriptional regulator n=2 Tax=Paroceanicella profunda TaxID=2579971 RepID=A0A5B8G4Q0_9RHOB|nr:GntR family transcriptional regulator [Paroceanicella profunda]
MSTKPTVRTAEVIYAELVRRIVEGVLLPGDALNELPLAEEFGVSRTPVREALQHLSIAGLAERGPRRAFIVRRTDLPMLEDLFEALGEMEALCARLAALRMTAMERHKLSATVQEADAAARAGEALAYSELNARFHADICAGAHNRALDAATQVLRVRTLPWREAQFRAAAARLESSQTEHRGILRAILAEDGEAAHRAMRDHIAASMLVVAGIVAERAREAVD